MNNDVSNDGCHPRDDRPAYAFDAAMRLQHTFRGRSSLHDWFKLQGERHPRSDSAVRWIFYTWQIYGFRWMYRHENGFWQYIGLSQLPPEARIWDLLHGCSEGAGAVAAPARLKKEC